MAHKDKRWRAIRSQKRREKARLHKQTKPNREIGSDYSAQTTAESQWFFQKFLKRLDLREKTIDNRERNGRQGDR